MVYSFCVDSRMRERRNRMKVTLISHTPEPEKTVAAAAKLCYSKTGITGLMDGLPDHDPRL